MTGSRKEDPKDPKKPTTEEEKGNKEGAGSTTPPLTLSDMPELVLLRIRDNLLKGKGGAKVLSSLAQTSRGFSSLFAPDTKAQALKSLFKAVIDDDRVMAERILKGNPELALSINQRELVVESKYTFQKFNLHGGVSPLEVVCQRKQREMVKLLSAYTDQYIASIQDAEEKIEATKDKEKALSTWKDYETHINVEGIPEIIIPPEYIAMIQPLINAFVAENFPNGDDIEKRLSEATENALTSFREKLLPEDPVKVDYLDPELLLYAAYKAYDDHFDQFQDWEQRDHFAVKVIGFAQSILSPETAKVFCQGLYNVVEQGEAIGERAASLKLSGGQPFYRGSRDSSAGLGYEHVTDAEGEWSVGRGGGGGEWGGEPPPFVMENFVKQKQQTFRTYAATTATEKPTYHR